MGYSLHIHRGEDWWDESVPPITEGEWQAAVDLRGDFERRDELVARNPATGQDVRLPGPFWVWTGHPRGMDVPFSFRRGRISVDNPDPLVTALMVELAEAVCAKVQGDEGEGYPEWTEPPEPTARQAPKPIGRVVSSTNPSDEDDEPVERQSWWKKLFS